MDQVLSQSLMKSKEGPKQLYSVSFNQTRESQNIWVGRGLQRSSSPISPTWGVIGTTLIGTSHHQCPILKEYHNLWSMQGNWLIVIVASKPLTVLNTHKGQATVVHLFISICNYKLSFTLKYSKLLSPCNVKMFEKMGFCSFVDSRWSKPDSPVIEWPWLVVCFALLMVLLRLWCPNPGLTPGPHVCRGG